jgi:hypothetical protein
MRKHLFAAGLALSLAACGGGAAVVIQNIYDQIQAASQALCGMRPIFATIDAIIKALGGPPVVDTVAGIFCTQAKALMAQNIAPKAAIATEQGSAVVLGTVIINGKPVTITVLR